MEPKYARGNLSGSNARNFRRGRFPVAQSHRQPFSPSVTTHPGSSTSLWNTNTFPVDNQREEEELLVTRLKAIDITIRGLGKQLNQLTQERNFYKRKFEHAAHFAKVSAINHLKARNPGGVFESSMDAPVFCNIYEHESLEKDCRDLQHKLECNEGQLISDLKWLKEKLAKNEKYELDDLKKIQALESSLKSIGEECEQYKSNMNRDSEKIASLEELNANMTASFEILNRKIAMNDAMLIEEANRKEQLEEKFKSLTKQLEEKNRKAAVLSKSIPLKPAQPMKGIVKKASTPLKKIKLEPDA